MKTPAQKLGYKVGMKFEVIMDDTFSNGSHIVLIEDDRTSFPRFELIEGTGKCYFSRGRNGSPGAYAHLRQVKPLKGKD